MDARDGSGWDTVSGDGGLLELRGAWLVVAPRMAGFYTYCETHPAFVDCVASTMRKRGAIEPLKETEFLPCYQHEA